MVGDLGEEDGGGGVLFGDFGVGEGVGDLEVLVVEDVDGWFVVEFDPLFLRFQEEDFVGRVLDVGEWKGAVELVLELVGERPERGAVVREDASDLCVRRGTLAVASDQSKLMMTASFADICSPVVSLHFPTYSRSSTSMYLDGESNTKNSLFPLE